MLKFVRYAVAASLFATLAAGCGGGGGGGSASDPLVITEENAASTTYAPIATVSAAESIFWSMDDLWYVGDPARLPAHGRGAASPFVVKMRELAAKAKSSGSVSPLFAIPTDYELEGFCGGLMTVNGTVTTTDNSMSINAVATLDEYNSCLGTALTGDLVIVAEGDADLGDNVDDFTASIDADDLEVFWAMNGRTGIVNGTLDVDGSFVDELYAMRMYATVDTGYEVIRLSNVNLEFDESAWPEASVTIEGTFRFDGDKVLVYTLEDLVYYDFEADQYPQEGQLLIDGKGALTVTFGLGSGDVDKIMFQLDGNEDGDFTDASDSESGWLDTDIL